ncbi:mannose-6-phosphate isomerase [Trichodelitschia bisporula]|uniref:Mannose-6-phosphate isomerase n=1 Tax=Trichodelitschia bisporula TaxID=703511 RepID=A0A6G1HPH3_9PEZI|nr:mannose-6-phosphate isomerase [Trichodelitschia bisporula]
MPPVPLFRLQAGVNSYDWGKVGHDSAAARFAAATPSDSFTISSDKPYAELWMGTHPSLPSKDLVTGRTLLDLVRDNTSLLGPAIAAKYDSALPFLFKVLSINKALSIQAHPNKGLAEQLHAKDPKNYPDDNHKPEMTIAITPFEGLCGFRPLGEIAAFLGKVSALRELVGEEAASKFESTVKGQETSEDESAVAANKDALKTLFTALMTSSPEKVSSLAPKLLEQAESEGESFAGESTLSALVQRLNSQFPSDIGLFVLFLLNHVRLSPGEALFLKADDIHAYLSGDVIETMAASDNVVRAGFTPKFKDVSTLTSMLTYSYAPIEAQKLQPVPYPYVSLNAKAYTLNSAVQLYDPPIAEFAVVQACLGGKGAKVTLEGIEGPSILLCTEGRGKISVGPKVEELAPGFVYFIGATAELVIEAEDEPLVAYKAFCEPEDKDKERL